MALCPPRQKALLRRAALCAALAGGCAGAPPRAAAPGLAEPASTLAVAALEPPANAEPDLWEVQPGTLVIYSSIAGHVPFSEVTREGIVYRGRNPAEREAARGAAIEEEMRQALEREQVERGALAEELRVGSSSVPLELARFDALAPPRRAPHAPDPASAPASSSATAVTIPPGSWANRVALRVLQERIDRNGDGVAEETRFVDERTGLPVRRSRDRDGDGQPDTWEIYEAGALIERVRDTDGDGRSNVWDRYREGRLAIRKVDRNNDGSVESIYRYAGETLGEERHDANGDGALDLVVSYEDGVRARSEEDRDGDGRADTWTHWQLADGEEVVTRIERDRYGRGRPDVVEFYELAYGQPVLARLEEDEDGDGTVDVTSYFEKGELVRREVKARETEELEPL